MHGMLILKIDLTVILYICSKGQMWFNTITQSNLIYQGLESVLSMLLYLLSGTVSNSGPYGIILMKFKKITENLAILPGLGKGWGAEILLDFLSIIYLLLLSIII